MTAEQAQTHVPVPDEALTVHASLVTLLGRLYPKVPREDISQELWLAYYANQGVLDEEADGDGDYPEKRLRRVMRSQGERFCRREKAAAAGYETHDEVFYSLRALRELCVQWFAAGVTESPPRTYESSVTRKGDASQGGDWVVSLIDAGEAIRHLHPTHQEILFYAYSPDYAGMTDEDIVIELSSHGWKGLTADKFRGKVRWALNRLQKELGGQNPWGRDAKREARTADPQKRNEMRQD